MHRGDIRDEIVDRVLAKRGKFHVYETLDPSRTALLVIDMQNTFCQEGAAAEVPASRSIVQTLNALIDELRELRVKIVWITMTHRNDGGGSEWNLYYNGILGGDVRERSMESMSPTGDGQEIWHELNVEPDDVRIVKTRYSALIPGSSHLERWLHGYGIENVLIAGTKTNVCCESTARDAMQLDFRVVMLSDCCAALSDDEHRATLENVIQQFGDVMTAEDVVAALRVRL